MEEIRVKVLHIWSVEALLGRNIDEVMYAGMHVCLYYMFVGIYVCMYICMYVCIYVGGYVIGYVSMYVCELKHCFAISLPWWVCRYVCMYVCRYICNYVYMYVCMYVCMYICMYVCRWICNWVCCELKHCFVKLVLHRFKYYTLLRKMLNLEALQLACRVARGAARNKIGQVVTCIVARGASYRGAVS